MSGFRLFGLVAALSLTSAPALASVYDDDDVVVGVWQIGETNLTACYAVGSFSEYKTGESVSLSLVFDAKDQDALIMFSNTKATSITNGQKVDLGIAVLMPDGSVDDGWGEKPFTAKVIDGKIYFSSAILSKEILTDFAKASALAFFYKENVVSSFPMKDSALAIKELRKCAFNHAGLNPDDPFLK